jgi:hypothetical protein
MNFDLNDVASSSSDSSSSSSLSSHRHHAASSVSRRKTTTTTTTRVTDVDENLAYELRSALHLAIGKICRAEDMVSSSSSLPDNDTTAADSSPTMPSSKKTFKMNNESIIALTDLTYHFITTCYANDLVAFSHHAKRKQVKLEDVLLVARKDEVGALAELHRVIADNPSIYGSTTTNNVGGGGEQKKNGGMTMTKKRKDTAPAAAVKERSRPTTSKNNKRQSKLLSTSALLKKKGRKTCLSSSSSSSSSGESDDDDEDDDDDSSIGHNHGLKMRRRKLELERQSLSKAKQKQKLRRNVGLSDDDMNSDDSIHDFIAKEDDNDEEIDFTAIGEAGVKTRKTNDNNDSDNNESTDYNYLDSAGIGDGGKKIKKLDQQLSSSSNNNGLPLDDCSMIIDLCEE